jgi:hypothetical protein
LSLLQASRMPLQASSTASPACTKADKPARARRGVAGTSVEKLETCHELRDYITTSVITSPSAKSETVHASRAVASSTVAAWSTPHNSAASTTDCSARRRLAHMYMCTCHIEQYQYHAFHMEMGSWLTAPPPPPPPPLQQQQLRTQRVLCAWRPRASSASPPRSAPSNPG